MKSEKKVLVLGKAIRPTSTLPYQPLTPVLLDLYQAKGPKLEFFKIFKIL